ncbi:MAG: radical SAM protein [Candidatus Omnitrophica bacterium]|nr:radical SAM protein [Candidatus Omnitrophota bacterium]
MNKSDLYPSYRNAFHAGSLAKRARAATALLSSCNICPRQCRVNRLSDELGFCKTKAQAKVFSFLPHHGEEPPISGSHGSGTIFFSHCNMACSYCQNYTFSQEGEGREVNPDALANCMIDLQKRGCHNINLVTPTHVMPQILNALLIAVENGLRIPLVYNTSSYELPEMIALLDGIVDIFLADLRYGSNTCAQYYSHADNYPRYSQQAVKKMHQQVGIAKINEEGIIERGLIIRHLVLPNNIANTKEIMTFIAQEISPDTFVSLMSQYLPSYKALEQPNLARRITQAEYAQAQDDMRAVGLHNGWTQEDTGLARFAGTNIKRNIT